MKTIGFAIAVAVVLISVTLSVAAQDRMLCRGDIPFSFTANGQTFQAGEYQVRRIGESFVRIEDVRTLKGVTLLSPQNVAVSKTIKLVFHSYGSRRFLAGVVARAYEIALPQSEAEREIRTASADATLVALEVKR
ncbi:MAG: hypothetical protein ACR2IF_06650 [Terriglobales bacterium]